MSAKTAHWLVILAAIIAANRVDQIGAFTGPGSV